MGRIVDVSLKARFCPFLFVSYEDSLLFYDCLKVILVVPVLFPEGIQNFGLLFD